MLTPEDLRGIADELRCNAEALRDGHAVCGEWCDDDARSRHDKLIWWADALVSMDAMRAERPPTPVGWSDTDWIKHLQGQDWVHPLAGQHINQGSMDAAADAYEAEYNEALKRDAARYRWLRDIGDTAWTPMGKRPGVESAAQIDRAIDAAMAKGVK